MNDICVFLPQPSRPGGLRLHHFVYETGIRKVKQPILLTYYRANLVCRGGGILKCRGQEYPLAPGTLFFTFPEIPYRIEEREDLAFLYTSFSGEDVRELLQSFQVSPAVFLFPGFSHLIPFWMQSIRRITSQNAPVLTESVLLHTLSFLGNQEPSAQEEEDRFTQVLRYVDNSFANPELTLMRVADLFFYSRKYLSSLFVKHTGVRFSDYVNRVRIRHAAALLENGSCSVADAAAQCGFSDPLYFSKVFRKLTGQSPSRYSGSEESAV